MSKVISVFCDTVFSSYEVSQAVEGILNIQLREKSIENVGVVYHGILEDVDVSVYGDHEFEDDCGIEFSKYSIAIAIESQRSESDLLKIAICVAKKLTEQLGFSTIVVSNFQKLETTFQ